MRSDFELLLTAVAQPSENFLDKPLNTLQFLTALPDPSRFYIGCNERRNVFVNIPLNVDGCVKGVIQPLVITAAIIYESDDGAPPFTLRGEWKRYVQYMTIDTLIPVTSKMHDFTKLQELLEGKTLRFNATRMEDDLPMIDINNWVDVSRSFIV